MLPPRLCHCGRIVKHGLRCECQRKADRARKARHDANRPSARERGYNRAWETARAEYLLHHPHCRMCAEVGRTTPATVVDHIKPHRHDKTLFWLRANWQPLCTRCHNSAKQRLERKPQ